MLETTASKSIEIAIRLIQEKTKTMTMTFQVSLSYSGILWFGYICVCFYMQCMEVNPFVDNETMQWYCKNYVLSKMIMVSQAGDNDKHTGG